MIIRCQRNGLCDIVLEEANVYIFSLICPSFRGMEWCIKNISTTWSSLVCDHRIYELSSWWE